MVKHRIKSWVGKYKYSLLFYLSMFILVLTWFLIKTTPKSVKIFSALFFTVSQAVYYVKTSDENTLFFTKFIHWLSFGLMFTFTCVYISFSVGDILIAVWFLFIISFVVLISNIVFYYIGLHKSKTIYSIILNYLLFSLLVIVLFGFVFTISTGFDGNGLVYDKTTTNLFSSWEYVYFSSSIYYSNALGDILPQGYSKLIVQFESVFSYVFHIIILGFLISNFYNKKEENIIIQTQNKNSNSSIQNDAEEVLVYSYKQKIEGKGMPSQEELIKLTRWDEKRVIFAMEFLIRKGLVSGEAIGAMGHQGTVFALFNDISPDGIEVIENPKQFEKYFNHTVNLGVYTFSWGAKEK